MLLLSTLEEALRNSWSKDTSHHIVRESWNVLNPSLGQCAVTSLVVNHYLGGKVFKASIVGKEYSHYWNELANNKKVDLTYIQFGNEDIKFFEIVEKFPKEMLLNKDLKIRYEKLLLKVENYIEV